VHYLKDNELALGFNGKRRGKFMPLAIVTGGKGFVGFNICKILIANNW